MRLPTGCRDPTSNSRDLSTRVQEERVRKRNVYTDDDQLALGPGLMTSGGGGFHDTTINTWTRRRHDTLRHGRPESERTCTAIKRWASMYPSIAGEPPILEHRRGVKAGGRGVRNVRRSVNEIEVRRVVLSV